MHGYTKKENADKWTDWIPSMGQSLYHYTEHESPLDVQKQDRLEFPCCLHPLDLYGRTYPFAIFSSHAKELSVSGNHGWRDLPIRVKGLGMSIVA